MDVRGHTAPEPEEAKMSDNPTRRDLSDDPAVRCLRRELGYRGRTATTDATWLGRRGRVTVHYSQRASANCERTVITEWIDDADPRNGGWPAGTTTIKCITGDTLAGKGLDVVAESVLTDEHRTWLAAEQVEEAWSEMDDNAATDCEADGAWQVEHDLARLVLEGYVWQLPEFTRQLFADAAKEIRDFAAGRE